jgi:aminoglycoside phosphotransferase (APT) family kinase protein
VLQQTLSPVRVSELLIAAGYSCRPSELQVEAREERWLVRLPGHRLAWFARSHRGLERLRTERRVLRLLERRCSFEAPRVLFESRDGAFDVRTMVRGGDDPCAVYSDVRHDSALASRLGAAIGAILAEQHSRIGADDVGDWLPRRPAWPEPRDWISERLPTVVDDADLIARAERVIAAYERVCVDDLDRVLVHSDVGFHNLSIDTKSATVDGVFDYEAAAWADRHHDFRYLVFDFDGDELFEAARAAYEPVVGRTILRDRVLLYNAACAASYLAYRAGRRAGERWCGRTLAEDLRWSDFAISKALGAALS